MSNRERRRMERLSGLYLRGCALNGLEPRPVVWVEVQPSGARPAFVVLEELTGEGVQIVAESDVALINGVLDVLRSNRPARN